MGVLDGKVAIVTGGGQGIGRASARMLGEHGARVVVADLDAAVAAEAAAELDGEAVPHVGDITEDGVPEAIVELAVESWGRLDIVVNNAGYYSDAVIHKMDDLTFDQMMAIHVRAPFRMLRAAAPYLREPAKRERDTGQEVFRKVVNVSSSSGTMGNAGQAGYASGKAAVVGLTKTIAKEWGPLKINCNAVAFGFMDTRLSASRDEGHAIRVGGESVALGIPGADHEAAVETIPLGRRGTVEEAAGPIFFLCSPWSDYVHGQVLPVNGGQMLGMTT